VSLQSAARRRIACVVLALSFCTGLAACAAPRTRAAEHDVREFVARLVLSVNDANADAFVACFAPDATAFFPSSANAARRTGHAAIRAAIAPTFARGRPATVVEPRDLQIRIDSETALVTFDAGVGANHARRTLVLRRSAGGWAITHLHASNVSE
jgi:ketosteroid isomerase-like protein